MRTKYATWALWRAAAVTAAGALLSTCAEDTPTRPNVATQAMSPEAYDGEFIGNLYVNGVKSSEGYDVTLEEPTRTHPILRS